MPSGTISDSHACLTIISIRPVQSTARVSRPETQCAKNGAEGSVLDNLQLTVRGAPNLRRQPPPLHPVGTHPHGAVVRYHIHKGYVVQSALTPHIKSLLLSKLLCKDPHSNNSD